MHISPNSSSENRLIFNAHSSSFVKSKNQEQDPLTCLSVLFGVILFSCIVTRSAFLLRVVNYLAFVDCLRRDIGSWRLQPCS